MTLAIISHPDCELHDIANHPEQPARIKVINKALHSYPFNKPVKYLEAPLVTYSQLKLAHDENYLRLLEQISPKEGYVALDADTIMNPFSLTAAKRAAGSCIYAVDLVMTGKISAAFCNVRPPGHHAERDKAMGFCFYNNVAVGVYHALDQYQLNRIAIIDFDVHHGNGTQDIFQLDSRVMLCSSFQHPFYPGYDPKKNNQHILNVPLSAGTKSEEFRQAVSQAWFEPLKLFKPELIFFSAGFDAHKDDPLASLLLTDDDYEWLSLEIAAIAKSCGHQKMISVLEGGYNLQALSGAVPKHVAALF